ncbi:hypothetical protein BGAL_0125g00100 [Botrytis galanthina]|uniref:Uncharacterized protein n=1 Tax=Botrytis galanthina TaxID=278940 RepID=A0A4S8RCA9_9HELO|nr:hypothetical protein BGAL_0125g00100 [Botrytis galanthina]
MNQASPTFELAPATRADIPRLAYIHVIACLPDNAFALYFNNPKEFEQRVTEMLEGQVGDPNWQHIKVVNKSTNEITAWASWNTPTDTEIRERDEKAEAKILASTKDLAKGEFDFPLVYRCWYRVTPIDGWRDGLKVNVTFFAKPFLQNPLSNDVCLDIDLREWAPSAKGNDKGYGNYKFRYMQRLPRTLPDGKWAKEGDTERSDLECLDPDSTNTLLAPGVAFLCLKRATHPILRDQQGKGRFSNSESTMSAFSRIMHDLEAARTVTTATTGPIYPIQLQTTIMCRIGQLHRCRHYVPDPTCATNSMGFSCSRLVLPDRRDGTTNLDIVCASSNTANISALALAHIVLLQEVSFLVRRDAKEDKYLHKLINAAIGQILGGDILGTTSYHGYGN